MNRQLVSFLGRLIGQSEARRPHRPAPKRRPRWQPSFECLEDRAVPSVTSFTLAPESDSGVKGDLKTNMTDVFLQGRAAAGDVVQILDGNGAFVNSTTSDGVTGNFKAEVLLNNGDGDYTFQAQDSADQQFGTGPNLTIHLLTTPPSMPFNMTVANDNTAHPTISGQQPASDAGVTIQLSELGGGFVGQTTANQDGDWSYPVSGLGQGQHLIVAKAIDAAGNTSDTSQQVVVTIPAPVVSTTVDASTPPHAPVNLTALVAQQQQERAALLTQQQQQLKNLRRHGAPASKIKHVRAQQAKDLNALRAGQAVELQIAEAQAAQFGAV
jgi:hypothetical protein